MGTLTTWSLLAPIGLLVVAVIGGMWKISHSVGRSHQKLETVEAKLDKMEIQLDNRLGAAEKDINGLKTQIAEVKGDVRDVRTRQDLYFQIGGGSNGGVSVYTPSVEAHYPAGGKSQGGDSH